MTLHPRLPPAKRHLSVSEGALTSGQAPGSLQCGTALCSVLSLLPPLFSLYCDIQGSKSCYTLPVPSTPTRRSLKEVERCLLPLPGMLRERQMELEGVGKGGLWAGRSSFRRKCYGIKYHLTVILTSCSFSNPLLHSSHTQARIYIVSLFGH